MINKECLYPETPSKDAVEDFVHSCTKLSIGSSLEMIFSIGSGIFRHIVIFKTTIGYSGKIGYSGYVSEINADGRTANAKHFATFEEKHLFKRIVANAYN